MVKKIIKLLCIIALIIILWGANNIVAQENNFNNEVEISINAGFQDNKGPEGWIPLKISIKNNSKNYFQGDMKLIVEKRDIFSESENEELRIFNKNIKLEAESKKYISLPLLYKRNYFSKPKVILKNNKEEIIFENLIDIKVEVNYGYNILVINQAGSGYNFLENYSINGSISKNNIYYISADNLAEHWLVYREMDLIILGKDNFNQLNIKQIRALKNWLNMGNTILISGEGDFFSYNSLLIEELCPFEFIKKELIEMDNSLAYIWLLKNKNGDKVLNNGKNPQLLKYKIGNGNVIFAALEPLSINKKEEFYFKIIPEKYEKGHIDYGFIKDYEKIFINEITYQYSYLYYLIPIFILYLILLYYIYQKLQEEDFGIKKFLIFFIIFVIIFSNLFYFSVGKNIIRENNILSEIAIIELNESNERVFVESYLSYLSHPLTKVGFYIKNENAFLIEDKNNNNGAKNTKLELEDENIFFEEANNNTWQSGHLRSYYFSELDLNYELFRKNNKLNLKLENNSNINLKHIYIYYNRQWYDVDGLKSDQKDEIELYYEDNLFRGNRNRVYKNVANMNGYLTEEILNKVVDEVINYRSDVKDKVFIFGLLEGKDLKGSINFIDEGKKIFSGIFYLPLDINNIE